MKTFSLKEYAEHMAAEVASAIPDKTFKCPEIIESDGNSLYFGYDAYINALCKNLRGKLDTSGYFRVDNEETSRYYLDNNYLFTLSFKDKTLNHYTNEQMKKLIMMK